MHHSHMRRTRGGFTLIEVLVVIGIIAILVALLLPAVQNAREAARKTECRSNLHNLGVALHSYHEAHDVFPPGVIAASNNLQDAHHSAFVLLLPFVEQRNLYDRFDFRVPWRDPVNVAAARSGPRLYRCPSAGDTPVPEDGGFPLPKLDYAFSKGNRAYLCLRGVGGGMFDVNSSVRGTDVRDGLSTTFAMGEAATAANLAARAP